MRSPRLLAMAAILFSSVAAPASAAWDRIGSVDFSGRYNSENVQYGNFGGRVESLALQARGSDVWCQDVSATFGNGRTRQLYKGPLPRGQNVTLDVPGESRMIREVRFNCRAMRGDRARVDIAADVGRYQAEWRRSPDWERMWSRVFPWANFDNRYGNDRYVTGRLDSSGWITLGSERFDGRYDQEVTFTGVRGRDVNSIALRPLNDDARCSDVRATFANGATRDLNIGQGDILRRDQITTIDLPGNRRDIERIDMTCRAEHGGMVTMQVLASR